MVLVFSHLSLAEGATKKKSKKTSTTTSHRTSTDKEQKTVAKSAPQTSSHVTHVSHSSEDKTFGAGPEIGEPFGINAKYWFSNSPLAVQAFVGYDFSDEALALFTDLLYHFKNVANFSFPWDDGKLSFYVGAGPKVAFANETQFGIRIPFGVNTLYTGQKWDTFAELVPRIGLAPKSSMGFDFGFGLRYYF